LRSLRWLVGGLLVVSSAFGDEAKPGIVQEGVRVAIGHLRGTGNARVVP